MGDIGKRKYYKNKWFWAVGLILTVFFALSGIKPQTNPTSAKNGMITSTQAIEAGTYKVGTDIKAGDYVLASDQAIIAKTYETILFFSYIVYETNGLKREPISLMEGQYLTLETQKCTIYPATTEQKAVIKDGKINPGAYLVGFDIPAGEYDLYNYLYAELSVNRVKTSRGTTRSFCFSGKLNLQLNDGDIILIKEQPIITTSSAPKNEEITVEYNHGENTIGKEVKAGEYVLIPENITDLGFISFYHDDDDDLQQKSFYTQSRTYVTFTTGQRVYITRCKIYTPENAPKIEIMDGKLPAGMYKVGVDIPEGNYTLMAKDNAKCIYNITTDSKHTETKYYFYNTQKVTVKNGEYLSIENGYILTN